MTDSPLVSVLLTTYDHAPYVEKALDSVLQQRTSGFDDVEVVITDDCSTDGTAEVIRRWLACTGMPAIFEVHERNLGICATRNRALARSRGMFVCSLSGDDWYLPGRLANQSAALLAAPQDVAALYSDVQVARADGSLRLESYLADLLGDEPPPEGHVFERLHSGNVLPAMGVMVRRSAIDAVGGYDEALTFEDWDMWLRLADRYRFTYLPGRVAVRRELPTSLGHSGHTTARMQRSVVRLNERWLGRDETARRTSAFWIRRAARIIATEDRAEARALLRSVAQVPRLPEDDGHWDALAALLLVPGSGRVLPVAADVQRRARALLQAEAGAWRSGRRLGRAGS